MLDQRGNHESSSQSDVQLWIQLKSGSELALGKLIKQFFNPLLNYGYKFVKDEDFVKDCVQEVFIEIWQRRDRISTPDSVKAYLLSSVRKKVVREGFRQHIIKNDDDDGQIANYTNEVDLSPEAFIISKETTEAVTNKINGSLDKLPKRQREVLYLQYYQNLSRDEIAQIMDINPQSVSNLIQVAFKSFKDNWSKLVFVKLFFVFFQ